MKPFQRLRRLTGAAAATLSCCLMNPAPAHASSFQINPVLVELETDKASAVLKIQNLDQAPIAVRVQVRSWTQEDGIDRHAETNDIIMSPPIATIQPGGVQLVRLGQRERGAGEEKAYRVIVEEIPGKPIAGNAVMMALRIDLPMYVLPRDAGKADVRWKAWRAADGQVTVEAVNAGTSRAELAELGWIEANGQRTMMNQRAGVVLAKSRKTWPIALGSKLAAGGRLKLLVRTPDGEDQVDLALQDR